MSYMTTTILSRASHAERCRRCTEPATAAPPTESHRRLWAHYEKQEGPNLCGVASAVVAINALHGWRVALQDVALRHLPRSVPDRGVSLSELQGLFAHYGCTAEVQSSRDTTMEAFRGHLLRREQRSGGAVTIVNFHQPIVRGAAQRPVGHFSPVSHYDAATDTLFLLDVGCHAPCAPGAVPLDVVWRGMRTWDQGAGAQGASRGYLSVALSEEGGAESPSALRLRRTDAHQ